MPAIIGHNLQHKGAWSSATQYYEDNIVSLNGSSYICILGHLNQAPPNATYWELVAAKGDPGDNGEVQGGAGSTDNALIRADGTDGTDVQGSTVTLSDGGVLTVPKGTITASAPHTFSETWNSGAVTFIGTDITVTDTASASASRVFRIRVGGTVIAAVSKTQLIGAAGSVVAGNAPGITFEGFIDTGFAANADNIAIHESGTIALNLSALLKEFRVPSDFKFAWSSATNNNSSSDTSMTRSAAGVVGISSIAVNSIRRINTALTPSGTSQNIDWTLGNCFSLNLGSASGDVTLTFTAPAGGGISHLNIKLVQGATARDIEWPAAVKWEDGGEPTWNADTSKTRILSLFYDGTNYWATSSEVFT